MGPSGCGGHGGVVVNAAAGGGLQRLAGHVLGAEALLPHKRPGRGQGVVAAGADADQPVVGFQDIAGAGQDQGNIGVGDRHHRLQVPQIAVRPPVLGQLHGRPGQLSGILFELGFQALEQGERIRRGAGESGDHLAVAETADLPRALLDNGVADAHLPVAGDHHLLALADGQNGGTVPGMLVFMVHEYPAD